MVEILITLVIVGIFSTVLFQLVRGQAAFTQTQTARQEAEQNVRGALELLAGELRSVPGSAIDLGEENRLRYFLPRAFGIVCSVSTSTIVAVFPPLPAGTVPLNPGLTPRYGMLAFDVAQNRWVSGLVPGTRSQVTGVEEVTGAAAACPQSDVAGDLSAYRFTGSGFPAVGVGSRVALFELVQYDVGTTSGLASASDSLWVERGTGAPGTQQPLAGPLPAANSLTFRYRDAAGTTVPQPITTLSTVGSVVVRLTARSRRQAAKDYATQTDSVTIFLRN